jgi:hypothetical protein
MEKDKDYDDSAFEENAKTDAEDKAEAKKLMKTGKMAAQPEEDAPKIKMRCGKKNGGLVKQGKPKLAKKRMEIMLKKIKNKICKIICKSI